MQKLTRLTLICWLFIKTLVYIIAFILIIKACDLIQVWINFPRPITILIGQEIGIISSWSWSGAFLKLLIVARFVILVLSVFFLIPTSLIKSLGYKLRGIWLCFLFPSLKFFDTRIFYRSFLSISLFIFCELLTTSNALVYLPNH